MAEIKYSELEQWLLDEVIHLDDIPTHQLEMLANDIELFGKMWVAIELGRCPSTDRRTYILHSYREKPKFDYYNAELIKLPPHLKAQQ